MKQSQEIDQLATALSAAQGEFSAAPKDSENPHFRNKFASLKSVVETAMPVLAKHGLSITQLIGADEQGDNLTLMLMHTSGQWIQETMRLHLVKDDPQGQGSAVTYARRYSFMAALGIISEEDDDGNAASKPKTVRGYDYNPPVGGGRSVPPDSRKRPSPQQVVEISPKARLVRACNQDTALASQLWEEATNGGKTLLNPTELQLLLSRAEALAAAKPT